MSHMQLLFLTIAGVDLMSRMVFPIRAHTGWTGICEYRQGLELSISVGL